MELARQIRAVRPGMPILLASGFNATLSHENLRDAGILGLIQKLFSSITLAEAVQKAFATGHTR